MISVRSLTAVSMVLLGACSTTRVEYSANESCNLPSNVWRQIQTPTERDSLLALPDPVSGQPLRNDFVASGAQQEAWLEDTGGNLMACIYSPSERLSCYSRGFVTISFAKTDGTWVAGPVTQVVCVH